jgi:hypothetical protein
VLVLLLALLLGLLLAFSLAFGLWFGQSLDPAGGPAAELAGGLRAVYHIPKTLGIRTEAANKEN